MTCEDGNTALNNTVSRVGRSSLDDLLLALRRLDRLLEQAVTASRAVYGAGAAADPYRGLYIGQEEVDRLLAREPVVPILRGDDDGAEELSGEFIDGHSRLAWLQRAFGLSSFDLDVIVIALAPELDLRYERLYAYL